ncbi:MAG: DUF429 domain-containing protein [Lachnospiraceae bacterium]|nr:DUF429 domain-containing protein [Lachnospiraceae bacterium]
MMERTEILSEYVEMEDPDIALRLSARLDCRPDDILDALCLAVTAGMKAQGLSTTVPEVPERDARDILMQMVIPARMKGLERD